MEQKPTTSWLHLKAPAEGRVLARFATLGVKDKDGDVIEAGAIGEQQVRVSAYGHTSWSGALPVGVGRVFERGNEAIANLEFFLQTTHGRDHFNTIRGLGELGEWSMGFDVLAEAAPNEEQRETGIVRILKKLKVHEVSPVLQAAGVGTATLSAKCDGCGIAVNQRGRSPTLVLQTARASLAAAAEVLRPRGPEDTEVGELARFAAYCGHLLNGCPGRILEPAIKWFAPGEVACTGYMKPGVPATWVVSDLRGEALIRTVLHESAHHSQTNPRAPGAEAEAATFAKRWTRPVLAAFRWTDGQAHRIRVTGDRWPPFRGKSRHGDVVLQKAGARAWAYITTAETGPWLGIG